MTPDQAKDVVRRVHADIDGELVARSLDGSFVEVFAVDDEGHPFVGGGWIVGPDAQIFSYSANPAHTGGRDLIHRLLVEIYDTHGTATADDVDRAISQD